MKRFRLSTIMLLVVIAALCATVVVQQRRAAVREVELEKRVAMSELAVAEMAVMKRTKDQRACMFGRRGVGNAYIPSSRRLRNVNRLANTRETRVC
jgi:hypothetical protein